LTNGRRGTTILWVPRRRVLSLAVLGFVGLLGMLAANAISSPTGRTDPPLTSSTYPGSDDSVPSGVPDLTGIVAENWSDGTLGFTVSYQGADSSMLAGNQAIGIYIDADANRATGQFGDDYFIAAAGRYNADPTFTLQRWDGTTWAPIASPSLTGQFNSGSFSTTIAKSELGIGSTFNFDVWGTAVVGTVIYSDEAPDQPNYFTYTLGVAPATTVTTTQSTTTTPPAVAKLSGHVGPGATIGFVHTAKAGKATITITDRTPKDNFHLVGPGVNRKTGIAFTGTVVWTVTLAKGTYTFRSDAHRSLHGTLKVS
jgi:hypothetical protein